MLSCRHAIENNESLQVDDSFGKGDTSEISMYTDKRATALPLPKRNSKKRPRSSAKDSVSEAIISKPNAGTRHFDCQPKKVKCGTPQEGVPETTEKSAESARGAVDVTTESDEKEKHSVVDDTISENLNPALRLVLPLSNTLTQRDGKDFNSVDPEMAEAQIARALERKRKKQE